MQSKNSVHVRSTAKVSKALKNISKGDRLEQKFSKYIYQKKESIVLVSSLVLREINCGQIDSCVYSDCNQRIIIYELKSKPEGLNSRQLRRIQQSLELLCSIFNAEGQILIKSHCQKN